MDTTVPFKFTIHRCLVNMSTQPGHTGWSREELRRAGREREEYRDSREGGQRIHRCLVMLIHSSL
jgi:hypothetical protein